MAKRILVHFRTIFQWPLPNMAIALNLISPDFFCY